jgi:G6PDH family F420-dependent oxidoreductase
MKIGYLLSSEEFGPRQLIEQARAAERADFQDLCISDHYHPWNDQQGQSPFVWTVIGALAEAAPSMRVTTAVTCPTVRIHPAVIAQAAASAAVLLDGRFSLGVGSGEALNEHILGHPWPPAPVRLEMLEEAIGLVRELWTGRVVTSRGRHYQVDHARIYTRPETPPPILVSGLGKRSIELAARVGDGYFLITPDRECVEAFRLRGGDGKPVYALMKVCYGADEAAARRTAHRLWPIDRLPGELAAVLPTPEHLEQASSMVTEDMVAQAVPCGPDLSRHIDKIQAYADAGVDHLYVLQIGGGHEEFFRAYQREVLPRFQ